MLFWVKMKVMPLAGLIIVLIGFSGIATHVMAADDPAAPPVQPLAHTNARIDKIDGNDLTLHLFRGHSGVLRTVKLNDKTIVILIGGKQGKASDLKPDQWIKLTFTENPADHTWLDVVRIEPSMAPWDQAKLIEAANDEAKKAYRKRHGLAADAPAPDFDHDRKPTGCVHDNRVEPDGENWRVILISTLTIQGATQLVSRVEVPLDKSGKLVGEVKF